jgi:hypothetical protein
VLGDWTSFYGVVSGLIGVVKLKPSVGIFGDCGVIGGFGVLPGFSGAVESEAGVYIKEAIAIFIVLMSNMKTIKLLPISLIKYLTCI